MHFNNPNSESNFGRSRIRFEVGNSGSLSLFLTTQVNDVKEADHPEGDDAQANQEGDKDPKDDHEADQVHGDGDKNANEANAAEEDK